MRMFTEIARKYEEVFLKIRGRRYLYPNNFDLLIKSFRRMFWRHPLVPKVKVDFATHVREWPPLGSLFNEEGGYITT